MLPPLQSDALDNGLMSLHLPAAAEQESLYALSLLVGLILDSDD